MSHHLLPLLQLLCCMVMGVRASYRKFGFLNHDICPEDKKLKTLNLGAGAAIFTLDTFDTDLKDKYITCHLKIKADDGYGLMVYVEEMYLRRESGLTSIGPKCLDYIQFGIDDLIPFVTVIKSEKKCGNETGFTYDEPDGNLLIWLAMGPSYPSVNRESVKLTKLSVIVTAYLKRDHRADIANYRACGEGRRWIRKEYFCDKRVNCALDSDPADERPTICRHLLSGDGGQAGDSDQPADWQPPLNLVSITLILVSVFVILVLALLLVARMRRARWCCFSVMRAMESCELPERSVGLVRPSAGVVVNQRVPVGGGSSSSALLRHSGGGGAEPHHGETVYLPLAMHMEPRPAEHRSVGQIVLESGGGVLVRGSTPDTEPPPAYHDLFPAGYKFSPDKIDEGVEEEEEGEEAGGVLSSVKDEEPLEVAEMLLATGTEPSVRTLGLVAASSQQQPEQDSDAPQLQQQHQDPRP